MAFAEITALLGGWPGFELVDVKREEATEEQPSPRMRVSTDLSRSIDSAGGN